MSKIRIMLAFVLSALVILSCIVPVSAAEIGNSINQRFPVIPQLHQLSGTEKEFLWKSNANIWYAAFRKIWHPAPAIILSRLTSASTR